MSELSRKIKIAIVDDHVLVRQGLAKLLNSFFNFEVVSQDSSGNTFIEFIQRGQFPDIVLLDINMENGRGYEVASWLYSFNPGIKVLAISAFDDEMKIIRILKCGVRGFIRKSADIEQLEQAIRTVICGKYYLHGMSADTVLKGFLNDFTRHEEFRLSDKEKKFLDLLCTDMSYKEIAGELFVSTKTIDEYKSKLCKKFNARTRTGIVVSAIKSGVLSIS